MFFDSHAHLTSSQLFDNVEEVIARAQAAGVGAIVNICTDPLSLERGVLLSEKHPWIYQAAATTPHDVEKEGEEAFQPIAAAARQGHLAAVGETGLDYHYEYSNREIQKHFLRRYLQLALECQLPVIIHCREAFNDLFQILDEEYQVDGKLGPGVLHCFTGTMAEAEKLIAKGWFISMSGIVTFKKSVELQEVARAIPLSQLLIETDAPYLAPQTQRGKTNEPAFVVETAAFIAALKHVPVDAVAAATAANARSLFKIDRIDNKTR